MTKVVFCGLLFDRDGIKGFGFALSFLFGAGLLTLIACYMLWLNLGAGADHWQQATCK